MCQRVDEVSGGECFQIGSEIADRRKERKELSPEPRPGQIRWSDQRVLETEAVRGRRWLAKSRNCFSHSQVPSELIKLN